jgi:hypothetical protein
MTQATAEPKRKRKPSPHREERRQRRMVKRSKSDPAWWVENVLGEKPWAKQAEILKALVDHREVNVRSCHSAGKSWVASRAALWFLFNHPRSLVITTAPTARQVRGIIWREIATAHSRSRVPLGGEMSTTALRIAEDWLALGFTAADHDPDRFQGFHARSTLVIIDEACGVSEQIDTAVDSILSGEHCRLLRIGNPTDAQTPFGRAFAKQQGARFKISAFDCPNFTNFGITEDNLDDWRELQAGRALPYPTLVNPEWVQLKRKQWGAGSPIWSARIAAEFPEEGDNVLVPLHRIEAAQTAELDAAHPVSWGVDVARLGADETVVVERQGSVARIIATFRKLDTMQVAGRIARLYAVAEVQPERINVDEIGIGAGVLDRLNELELPVVGVNVGTSASDRERFANLRAEIFWNLRERFEQGEIDIEEDDELASQLASIRYTITSSGKIQLESKREQEGSPDRADALALAFVTGRADITRTENLDFGDFGLRSSPWNF